MFPNYCYHCSMKTLLDQLRYLAAAAVGDDAVVVVDDAVVDDAVVDNAVVVDNAAAVVMVDSQQVLS